MTIPTPQFTWNMIRMSPKTFAVHSLSHIMRVTAPVGLMYVEQQLFNRLAVTTQWATIWGIMAVYVIIMVAQISAALGAAWGEVTFRYRIKGALQHNALSGALHKPGAEPLAVSALEAINRLRDDVDEVSDFPLWIPEVIATSLAAFSAFALMCTIDVRLSLVVAVPLVLLGVVARILWKSYLHYRYAAGEVDDRYSAQLGSIIAAAQTLKLTASEGFALRRLQRLGDERRTINVRGVALARALEMVVNMGIALMSGIILWYGSQALMSGHWGIGDVLLLMTGVGVIGWWPNVIATFIGDYAQQQVSLQRLKAFVPHQPAHIMQSRRWWQGRDMHDDAPVQYEPLTQLTLDRVTYAHDADGHGIHEASLQIPAGALVAVVGTVGSGKSTLLQLCAGLLHPQHGHILWNGTPVTTLGTPAVVSTTQVPFLVSDTLRYNITLGKAVSPDLLMQVIERCQLGPDIRQLPAGLDTLVGPRGVRLSGGQRQRVALARMMLQPAQIVVLDDITSAVDSQTEALLWQGIRQTYPTQTIIASTHRPVILAQADLVVVVDNGRIVAYGPFAQLRQQHALLQQLWQD